MNRKFSNLLKNPARPWNLMAGIFKHVVLGGLGAWLIAKGLTTGALWASAVGSIMTAASSDQSVGTACNWLT